MREWREIYDAVQNLEGDERQYFFNLLVLSEIREILYYVILAFVVIILGRRLIDGLVTAVRENRRQELRELREERLDELEEIEEFEQSRRR